MMAPFPFPGWPGPIGSRRSRGLPQPALPSLPLPIRHPVGPGEPGAPFVGFQPGGPTQGIPLAGLQPGALASFQGNPFAGFQPLPPAQGDSFADYQPDAPTPGDPFAGLQPTASAPSGPLAGLQAYGVPITYSPGGQPVVQAGMAQSFQMPPSIPGMPSMPGPPDGLFTGNFGGGGLLQSIAPVAPFNPGNQVSQFQGQSSPGADYPGNASWGRPPV